MEATESGNADVLALASVVEPGGVARLWAIKKARRLSESSLLLQVSQWFLLRFHNVSVMPSLCSIAIPFVLPLYKILSEAGTRKDPYEPQKNPLTLRKSDCWPHSRFDQIIANSNVTGAAASRVHSAIPPWGRKSDAL